MTFLIYTVIEYVGLSSTRKSKKKSKVDQEQENPDDFREPSTEENERLSSALEDELPVEDVKDDLTHNPVTERKLIRIDKRSEFEVGVFFFPINTPVSTNRKVIGLTMAVESTRNFFFPSICMYHLLEKRHHSRLF